MILEAWPVSIIVQERSMMSASQYLVQTGIQDGVPAGNTEVLKEKKAERMTPLAVSYSTLIKEEASSMPELKEALHNSSDNQQGKDNQDPPPAFQQGDD